MTRHPIAVSLVLLAAFTAPALADPAAPTTNELEHVISHDGWSADMLFQLGTAYASSGHPGRAVLAYERAQLLAPRDAAIRAELSKTRDAAGIAAPPSTELHAALGRLSSDEWAWLSVGCGILAAAGAVAYAWSIRRSTSRVILAVGVLAAGVALTGAVLVAAPTNEAVVVTSDLARIAPFAAAEGAFTATEGEQVQIEQQRGEYIYVRDDDRAGWLPRSAVERVVGDPSVTHA